MVLPKYSSSVFSIGTMTSCGSRYVQTPAARHVAGPADDGSGTYGVFVTAPRGLNENWELNHWSEYGKRIGKYDVVSRTNWIDDVHEEVLMIVIERYRGKGDDASTSCN